MAKRKKMQTNKTKKTPKLAIAPVEKKVDEKVQATTPPAPVAQPKKQLLIESDGVSINATNVNNSFSMIELETIFSDLLREVTAIRQNAKAQANAPAEPTEPGK